MSKDHGLDHLLMRKRNPKRRRSKIFGIGLSRTGTTALNEALEILGFSAIHYPTSWKEIEVYDAATDIPIADAFEMLNAKFPGSKFLYTVREREEWLASCRRYWMMRQDRTNKLNRELRKRLYGTTDFDPDLFVQAYDRHERRVLSYFAERPEDLLVLDICGGRADWETLCSFLSVPVPGVPFPHTNRLASLDEILMRLLYAIGDSEQVAKIAKVSIPYVEDLRSSQAFRNYNAEAPLRGEGIRTIDRALARSCSYFGNVDAAAKLKIPAAYLNHAIVRHRRRKRSKRFKKVMLELRWLTMRISWLVQRAKAL